MLVVLLTVGAFASDSLCALFSGDRIDITELAALLAGGADPNERCASGLPAEIAVLRGDPTLVALLAGHGARLLETDSQLHLWSLDPVRIELAIALGAHPSREDIDALATGSQQHLLERLAQIDEGLPPSAWAPRNHPSADPATRQLLARIVAEKRALRREARRGNRGL